MTYRIKLTLGLFVTVFCSFSLFPQNATAQDQSDHVVTSADLQNDVSQAAKVRQQQIATIDTFLSGDRAKQALRSANIDYSVVHNGVASLSDDELARLSARADKAQKDFAAGALTNEQITYIIIALATAVIILIIVH